VTSRVAVIIVNYNTAELTVSCVESVLLSERPSSIVVVDNASAPEDQARLRASLSEQVRVVHMDQNYGFSLANNAGVEAALQADPEWLVFLNSDTVLRRGAIDRALEVMQDPTIGAVGMRFLHASDPCTVQVGPGRFNPLTGHVRFKDVNVSRAKARSRPSEVNFLHGGAMVVRTAAFLEAGRFPADIFMYGEDVELSLRLRRAGWRLFYQPGAEVLHHGGASGGGYMSPFSIYHSTLSFWRIMRRNFSPIVYLLYSAHTYLWFLPAFTVYCLLFRRHLVKPFLTAHLDHLRGRMNTPPPSSTA
jgi:GT2 family glycosyltransferase